MKKLTIVLTVFILVMSMGLSAQDLNDAGKAYNQGIELTKENKTLEAIEKYQKCAKIAGELGDIGEGLKSKAETQISSLYMKLGLDAYKANEYDTAISLFILSADYSSAMGNAENTAKADNYVATTYVAKGNSHYKEKKYDDALESFKMALDYNPEYFKAYYGQAICYNKADKTEEFEAAIKKVIELGGEDKTVDKAKNLAGTYFLNLSGEAIKKESYREAAMMAKKSIDYNYLEPTAYYYQALSCNNFESWDEAIKAAELGMKAEKGDKSNMFFELGRAYEGKGNVEKACEAYASVTGGPNVDAANYQRSTILNCN